MWLMRAAWREVDVNWCALLHRAIARLDPHGVTHPCALLSRFTPKDRNIERTVSSFDVLYIELLDPKILRAASSIPCPSNRLHSLGKNYTRTVLSCVYSEIFSFKLLDPEILKDNTQNIFCLELQMFQ